jgi:hypothetical protein
MGRRSATSSNSFWEHLRDEVAPPRRGESMKKLNLSPEAMGVINGAKKIGRLTRQVCARVGCIAVETMKYSKRNLERVHEYGVCCRVWMLKYLKRKRLDLERMESQYTKRALALWCR